MPDLYIDGEWFIGGKIFLIGYSTNVSRCKQLYGKKLNKREVLKMLGKAKNSFIFFYGPDIGVLESAYNIDIRNKYHCINLLTVFRRILPGLKSYKLAAMEKRFKIHREVQKYKQDIFTIFHDFKNPIKRRQVLKYNREDVINLMKIKKVVCTRHKLTRIELKKYRLA